MEEPNSTSKTEVPIYLSNPDFDPSTLTINELTSILSANDVVLPAVRSKKDTYVTLFNQHIIRNREKLINNITKASQRTPKRPKSGVFIDLTEIPTPENLKKQEESSLKKASSLKTPKRRKTINKEEEIMKDEQDQEFSTENPFQSPERPRQLSHSPPVPALRKKLRVDQIPTTPLQGFSVINKEHYEGEQVVPSPQPFMMKLKSPDAHTSSFPTFSSVSKKKLRESVASRSTDQDVKVATSKFTFEQPRAPSITSLRSRLLESSDSSKGNEIEDSKTSISSSNSRTRSRKSIANAADTGKSKVQTSRNKILGGSLSQYDSESSEEELSSVRNTLPINRLSKVFNDDPFGSPVPQRMMSAYPTLTPQTAIADGDKHIEPEQETSKTPLKRRTSAKVRAQTPVRQNSVTIDKNYNEEEYVTSVEKTRVQPSALEDNLLTRNRVQESEIENITFGTPSKTSTVEAKSKISRTTAVEQMKLNQETKTPVSYNRTPSRRITSKTTVYDAKNEVFESQPVPEIQKFDTDALNSNLLENPKTPKTSGRLSQFFSTPSLFKTTVISEQGSSQIPKVIRRRHPRPSEKRDAAKSSQKLSDGSFSLLFGVFSLIGIILFVHWYHVNMDIIGYCQSGVDQSPPTTLNPLALVLPTCLPCPPHALCMQKTVVSCDKNYTNTLNVILYTLMVPIPNALKHTFQSLMPFPLTYTTCELDLTHQLAEERRRQEIDNIIVTLKRLTSIWIGKRSCGEIGVDPADATGGMPLTLARKFLQSSTPKWDATTFNSYWDSVVDRLFADSVSDSGTTGLRLEVDKARNRRVLVVDESEVVRSLACRVRQGMWEMLRAIAVELTVISVAVAIVWILVRRRARILRENRIAVAIVEDAVDAVVEEAEKNREDPVTYPVSGLPVEQIREYLLPTRFEAQGGEEVDGWVSIEDESERRRWYVKDAVARERVWKSVEKIVHKNAMVRESVCLMKGEMQSMWEWVGSVSLLPKTPSRSRSTSRRRKSVVGNDSYSGGDLGVSGESSHAASKGEVELKESVIETSILTEVETDTKQENLKDQNTVEESKYSGL
ncbi:hypothetical protein HK096_003899 [Nowakowskiella sp. JEL0078]|nr:hypothetical protein HK096_003899 [Nowakowskiella sp. JEL0078]